MSTKGRSLPDIPLPDGSHITQYIAQSVSGSYHAYVLPSGERLCWKGRGSPVYWRHSELLLPVTGPCQNAREAKKALLKRVQENG